MIINRIGDFGLALGIFGVFTIFKAVDYATVFAMAPTLVGQTMIFFNVENFTAGCPGI